MTIVMPPGPVSFIGGTKYPHCIVLYCIGPYAAATVRHFSMKALARYQVILFGEQRHIRCEQLAQGCCTNNAAVGVEPTTSRSQVRCPTTTLFQPGTKSAAINITATK